MSSKKCDPFKKSQVIMPNLTGKTVLPGVDFDEKISNIVRKRQVIIFSPHIDDALLSMGSLLFYLARENYSMEIISIFTSGSSLTTSLTTKLLNQAETELASDYFLNRQQEDKEAIALLSGKCRYSHLGFIDAAWRELNGKPLYPITTLQSISSDDLHYKEKLRQSIESLGIDEQNACIFAPLGRGNHVDHVLTRDLCSEVFESPIYYSDFPYSLQYGVDDVFIAENQLKQFSWFQNEEDYQQKTKAIMEYRSQFGSFFGEKPLQLEVETFYYPSNRFTS